LSRDKTICRRERGDRFRVARAFLHQNVIVTASQTRSPCDAETYPGLVEAVAWGVEGGNDVLILTLTGPRGAGMPQISIDLTKIMLITG
jgi:hypothetical protein